ncbi:hypothetical protein D0Z00_000555 [Geotrichum galactomycetum]|uniref:Uncharacterized protein n=1 Tax=Geotrichum galactomycetum TaxID=27317 RepID=A0ACB6V9M6_9ASCO|nr:hypothetical protein D0Z00_000555 [Geotrichum candidum]
MKTFFTTILATVVFLAALVQANFYDSPSSPVVPFQPAGKGQLRPQLTITEFYAPWCGHCQRLTPEYIKAAKRLAGAVRFTAINCDAAENKAVCGRYDIKGYPTIKVFDHGPRGLGEDYPGPREAKHLVKFLSDRLKTLTAGKVRAVTNAKTFERFVVAPPELDPVSTTNALKKRVVLLAGKKPEVPLLYRSLALEYSNFGVPAANNNKKKNKKAKRTPPGPTVEFVFVEPKLVARVAAHYNLTTDSLVEGASTLLSIDAAGKATVFAGALKREPVVAYIEAYVNQPPAGAPEFDRDEL